MVSLAAIQIGGFRYNSPWTQIILVGFVAFSSVGIFSAIGGLGAGGTQDVQLVDISSSVLYATFAFSGFIAGSINNIFGPRLTMSIGTCGYAIYLGSLWSFQLHNTRWFVILAGAILGFCGALFWAAQGSIMMAYPLEKDKGRSFTVFWAIFQLGTLIGAAIALGIEFHSTLPGVSTGVYVAFLIIMLTAIGSSWLVLPPQAVVRKDGSLVELEPNVSPRTEFAAFLGMFKDWRLLLLFPMFFSSNYFYAYQGALTAYLFNGRTRALVSLLTGLGSMLGSVLVGFLLDNLPFHRRKRSLVTCGIVALLMIGIWGGGLAFQLRFQRDDAAVLGEPLPWDWTAGAAVGPILLLLAYYIIDATFQGLAYYTMSSLTNDPFKLARMAGYYKGIQSAGSAVSFGIDAVRTPYLNEQLVSWLLTLVSLALCACVLFHTRDTNIDVEHTVFVEDLAPEKLEGIRMPGGHAAGAYEATTEAKVGTHVENTTKMV
ncbi:UNC93-like protein [Sporothrix schenckii 1099-18]|uniref:Major facilitator superfamily (MFS) profile domain-containing protein n=2 Tax=Sporothrix schenckii TaxID=29908 RepID=U7Q837_SPOS1|nr:UNC93-like protein [Sporothrix schenckii 1099-18]ERT03372.1 hypothetical protein HMPREF1624_01686 [Sporothrix schenckii ATCC 58251]KJR84185.1 UNC93-like protein [Sporothrix schenckii 1099-18]